MSSGRILIIRGGAIGDFVLTLPVFQALKENFPEAQVDILGYPNIARLAEISGLVNQSRAIEAQAVAGFFARNGELDESWSDYFSQFEIIISYLYDPDEIFQTNVKRCTKAQFIQGPHRPNETKNLHATQVFLEPLEKLAIFEASDAPKIDLKANQEAPHLGGSWLVLHPGSGSKTKNWPLQNWTHLIDELLVKTTWQLMIVGGEAEREDLHTLTSGLDPKRIQIEFSRPLDELASLLGQCEGFVGHDSGISHLASAVGLPGLVLWGPSNEVVWRPRSEEVVVIKHENGLEELPVDHVLARIPSPRTGS